MAIKATKVRFTGAGKGKISSGGGTRVKAGKNTAAQNRGYFAALAAGYFDDGGKRARVKRNYGTIPD